MHCSSAALKDHDIPSSPVSWLKGNCRWWLKGHHRSLYLSIREYPKAPCLAHFSSSESDSYYSIIQGQYFLFLYKCFWIHLSTFTVHYTEFYTHTHTHTHTHTQNHTHIQKNTKKTVVCLQLDCYIWRLDQQLASIFFSLSWSKQNKSISVHYARSEFCRLLQNLLGLLIIKYRIMPMKQWTLIKMGGKHAESYTQWILPSASLTAPTVEKDPRIFFMSGNSSDLSSCVERRLGCCLSSLENSKLA